MNNFKTITTKLKNALEGIPNKPDWDKAVDELVDSTKIILSTKATITSGATHMEPITVPAGWAITSATGFVTKDIVVPSGSVAAEQGVALTARISKNQSVATKANVSEPITTKGVVVENFVFNRDASFDVNDDEIIFGYLQNLGIQSNFTPYSGSGAYISPFLIQTSGDTPQDSNNNYIFKKSLKFEGEPMYGLMDWYDSGYYNSPTDGPGLIWEDKYNPVSWAYYVGEVGYSGNAIKGGLNTKNAQGRWTNTNYNDTDLNDLLTEYNYSNLTTWIVDKDTKFYPTIYLTSRNVNSSTYLAVTNNKVGYIDAIKNGTDPTAVLGFTDPVSPINLDGEVTFVFQIQKLY